MHEVEANAKDKLFKGTRPRRQTCPPDWFIVVSSRGGIREREELVLVLNKAANELTLIFHLFLKYYPQLSLVAMAFISHTLSHSFSSRS